MLNFEYTTQQQPQLMVMGVCLENKVGSGKGPTLKHVSRETLKAVKIPHSEVVKNLKEMVEHPDICECWSWNTCNRFEIYVICTGSFEVVENILIDRFFKSLPRPSESLNCLRGVDAKHHLLRTLLGLNSGLPGESDVEQQFEAAIRIAEYIGSLGPYGRGLVEEVIETGNEARNQTRWKNYCPSYCQAALEGVFADIDSQPFLEGPVVIVGSSTTSRSCVEHLVRDFKISPERVTLYHRCHKNNGQVKSIKRMLPGCERERVEDYSSPVVQDAIHKASLVVLGIDRQLAVLKGSSLIEARNGTRKPLAILDFNTLGSTENLQIKDGIHFFDAKQLDEQVTRYAQKMLSDPGFWQAVSEVESWLENYIQKKGMEIQPVYESLIENDDNEPANPVLLGGMA